MKPNQNKTEVINISLSETIKTREKLKTSELQKALSEKGIIDVGVKAEWDLESGKWAVSLSGQGDRLQEAARILARIQP